MNKAEPQPPAMLNRRAAIGATLVCIAAPVFGAAPVQAEPASAASKLVAAARSQIGITRLYDPAYARLAFPLGDVPRQRGVCSDVVIRACRDAFGRDLQALVHADMAHAFAQYPRRWGLSHPDSNIDHRRVANLQVYWHRQGAELPLIDPTSYNAGDIVTMLLPGNLPHIGIVSDKPSAGGVPLFIHNIGNGTQEEDVLTLYPRTGRYRWLPA